MTNTSATFLGQSGKTYRFYSTATDNTGNIEESPLVPDASTSPQSQTDVVLIASATIAIVAVTVALVSFVIRKRKRETKPEFHHG